MRSVLVSFVEFILFYCIITLSGLIIKSIFLINLITHLDLQDILIFLDNEENNFGNNIIKKGRFPLFIESL